VRGFPLFEHGEPPNITSIGEANERLSCLIWEDMFPNLLAQAALMLLTSSVGISAMRLWRRRG